MPEPQKRPAGAVDMTASDLVAVATGPAAVDRIIKDISDRRAAMRLAERNAKEAEAKLAENEAALAVAKAAWERDAARLREALDAREAACAEREAALVARETHVAEFNKWLDEQKSLAAR